MVFTAIFWPQRHRQNHREGHLSRAASTHEDQQRGAVGSLGVSTASAGPIVDVLWDDQNTLCHEGGKIEALFAVLSDLTAIRKSPTADEAGGFHG